MLFRSTAARDTAARDTAARNTAARNTAARDTTARDTAVRDASARAGTARPAPTLTPRPQVPGAAPAAAGAPSTAPATPELRTTTEAAGGAPQGGPPQDGAVAAAGADRDRSRRSIFGQLTRPDVSAPAPLVYSYPRDPASRAVLIGLALLTAVGAVAYGVRDLRSD